MEEESNSMSVWKTLGLAILILSLIFILFILMDIIFGNGSMTGNVVAGLSGETTKLECKNQEYDKTEYYTEVENGKNCDKTSGCRCIHESWWGLGACDSCECSKSRTVTKHMEVCVKVKKWQEPNFNENWFNYPELYNKNGNEINWRP